LAKAILLDDRRYTDDRRHADWRQHSEREREFTFANNNKLSKYVQRIRGFTTMRYI